MQRATTTFAAGRRVVARGQELPDTDPLVKALPHLFEAAPEADRPKRPMRRKKAGGGDADGDA